MSDCQLITSGDKLFLFGGCGTPTGPTQAGAQFIRMSNSNQGWNNEFHMYDLNGTEPTCLCVASFRNVRFD